MFNHVCVFFAEELRCAGVTCPALQVPSCPVGSVLTKSYTPPAGCCPSIPAQCTCDLQTCHKPQCPGGQHPVLISEAIGLPGDCCDIFECQKGDCTEMLNLHFDCSPTISGFCTVGVIYIVLLKAISFLHVRLSFLLNYSPQEKGKLLVG